MKRIIAGISTLILITFGSIGQAQKNYWKQIRENEIIASASADNKTKLRQKLNFSLQYLAITEYLKQALISVKAGIDKPELQIDLPMPNGKFETFRIRESDLMSAELKKSFPDIHAFEGRSVTDPARRLCIDIGPNGFHAMFFTGGDVVFIDPVSLKHHDYYQVYYRKEFEAVNEMRKNCSVIDQVVQFTPIARDVAVLRSNGTLLRTYDLAVACTGEYGAFFGSANAASNAIVTTVNRVNQVYQQDVSVFLQLVDNADIIFTNPNTDPYPNGASGGQLINLNQAVVDDNIGSANYDIGHVFSRYTGNSSAGVAQLGCVCRNADKAEGVTGSPNPVGDPFDIDFVAHEMGHQFGANHTFNDCYAGNQRNRPTAFEPGSGVTVMGYAGICDAGKDIAPNSIAVFHAGSYDEIVTFTVDAGGNNCATRTNTNNAVPVANAGAGGFSIPRGTAFTLTGSANDANNDQLTYSWEQMNTTNTQRINNANSTSGPNFRNFLPANTPSRTFPNINNVINNNLTDWKEVIYNGASDRVFNFRLTVRDGRGGVDNSDLQFTVRTGSGPLTVTAPNTAVNWATGSQQTVTWNVANTNAAPVNAANVRITLSTDGGLTYPVTILASTPNDGSQQITVPNNLTTRARIRVEFVGANYTFFDISNVNFTISGGGGGINYCASSGGTQDEFINRVQIGSINNLSGNNNGYRDYTNLSTNLVRGVATSVTLTPGFSGTVYNEAWNVYIDYNRDGDFTDAGEMVASAAASSAAVTRNFTPPAATATGNTRMRIVMQYDAPRNNPCGSFTYGEVEDYTVNITAAAASRIALTGLEIGPNPTNGFLNIRSKDLIDHIQVADLSGSVIIKKQVKNNAATLDLQALSSGSYLITIIYSNGSTYTEKIVKQ